MNLAELKQSDRIIFECRSGSFAYGTNTEKSDVDIKGIFTQTKDELISFDTPLLQVSDETNDTVYYSLRRYIELAAAANPNILELMFMPEECVLKTSPLFEELKKYKDRFITVKCLQTHQAYALAQVKKAKGRNKWINNPQPEKRPILEDFAYFISLDYKDDKPARPVKFTSSEIYGLQLKVSSVEHCPGLYRLYESADKSKIFTDEQICCSSVSFEEEKDSFLGLLYLNENAYKKALTDHSNYWEWISKRNPERWKMQEKGDLDFDAKNMQHTIRLLLTAKHIAKCGTLKVRFSGEELTLLKNIRLGIHTYDELIDICEELNLKIEKLSSSNQLKDEISVEETNEIFHHLMSLK